MERTKQCVRIGGPLDNVMCGNPHRATSDATAGAHIHVDPPGSATATPGSFPAQAVLWFCNGESVPTGSQPQ
jgi:hypothetical protein